DPFGGADFSDFFEQFFGRGAGGAGGAGGGRPGGFSNRGNQKGGDYETEMEITLEEAYSGTTRIIQLENEKLRVTTKPGSYDGQSLRIKGKGGPGGQRGDLFVRIKVQPHPRFIRQDDDLRAKQTIDLYTAVLGGEALVHTLNGQLKVKITAGTQPDTTVRLRAKGMPVYGKTGVFGDLYVQWQVLLPENLNEQQKRLFEQLQTIR
ncbi:MAG: J domain-containing protein, partial [Saprospiraceae bacterium]